MARIMAIDFGEKRTGLAVSDPLQMIAGGLTTVATSELEEYLKDYFAKENVERIVMGYPKTLSNEPAVVAAKVTQQAERLRALFPDIEVLFIDERFTSSLALRAMIDGGMKKKGRQNKAMIDQISATIILQDYLETLKTSL